MGDPAEIGRLTDAIVELLPHLEAVWRWDTPDPRPADRNEWLAELDRPLPDAGVGLDQVLDQLPLKVTSVKVGLLDELDMPPPPPSWPTWPPPRPARTGTC